jgi:glycosyltransferase involved in cell wall biosynthesis
MDCERWKTGCGSCPDLTLYPAIRRDSTARNWKRKQKIYQKCQLHVSTPCHWLMKRVEQSMLSPTVIDQRVIPNGVDLSIFHPSDSLQVRAELELPADAIVLLFAANRWIQGSRAKDYATLRGAIGRLSEQRLVQKIVLVALGEAGQTEHIGAAEIRFVPYEGEVMRVARYYQAADAYLHAAHVDTFPTTILEALATGIPVVATAVCGIPEQVRGLACAEHPAAFAGHDASEATGILVPRADPAAMASAILRLMNDGPLRRCLGVNARRDAEARFDLNTQVSEYCTWYRDIVHRRMAPNMATSYTAEPSAGAIA